MYDPAMSLSIHRRPTLVRLVLATLGGSLVGTTVLLATIVAMGGSDWDMLLPEQGLGTAVARLYLAVLAAGVLPTVFIGSVLIGLKRASAATLVLTPAILFALILARMGDAHLALVLLPAMVTGGGAMLWWLASAPPAPEPVHLVFE